MEETAGRLGCLAGYLKEESGKQRMFSLFKKKTRPPLVSAVVAAAGSASRMNGVDKQRIYIDEIPVVVRSVEVLSACPRIREVVIVCREELIADFYALVQDFNLDKVGSVVAGGDNRQESVFRGIEACGKRAEFYVIHDGARPLVTPETVERCIDDAAAYGACAAGVPVKDTIKVAGPDGFVAATPNRENLVSIQTPQVFEAELYRQAMAAARESGRTYTDDCQLVEQFGRKVYISQGSYENIKITTPEDVAMAQTILALREGRVELWQE